MNNIMNPEGPVMLFFTKIAYSAYLNVLWFICCLPIIMRFLLCTALMAAIYLVMAFVIINIFTPIIIFGEGLCALIRSHLLANILQLCAEKAAGSNGTDSTEEAKETREI